MMEIGVLEYCSRLWIVQGALRRFCHPGARALTSLLLLVAMTGLISSALASPYGHPSPPPPVHQPPPMPPQPPVQPPVRPPNHVQDRIIQQRAVQDAQRAAQKSAVMDLLPRSQIVAKKINSWEDIAKLSEGELAALFKEWGLLPSGGAVVTAAQLKALWLGEARARGVPQDQINQMLKQVGGGWSQMAGQINGLVGAAGDPNAAMGSLFKQEYAKTCKCSPQAFADALGRAETRLGGQMQGAIAQALGGQGIPVSALPSAPVVTYSTGDQPVLVAQAIINQGQTQTALNAPPITPGAGPAPGPAAIAPPPGPAAIAPPPGPAAIAPPPGPAAIAPPPGPAAIAPPPGPAAIAPPPGPAAIAPPPGPAAIAPPPGPAAIAPPPGPAAIAPPPGPAAVAPPLPDPSLLDLTLPPPSDPSLLTSPPPGPDMTPADKSDSINNLPEVKVVVGPPAPEPPRCKTVECYQQQLDVLAIERKVIQQNLRSQPMIQALDTLSNIVMGVAPFTGPAAPGALVIGGTLKGLKVLVTAGNEAKVTKIQGGNQRDALDTFIITTGVEGSVEVAKELVSAGLGKFVPKDAPKFIEGLEEGARMGIGKNADKILGDQPYETFKALADVTISTVVDEAAPDVDASSLKFSMGDKKTAQADTKPLASDINQVMGGKGF